MEKDNPRDFLKALRYVMLSGSDERLPEFIGLRLTRYKTVPHDFYSLYMSLFTKKDDPKAKAELARMYILRGLFDEALKNLREAIDKVENEPIKADVLASLVGVLVELHRFDEAGGYPNRLKRFEGRYARLLYQIGLAKFYAFQGMYERSLEASRKELEFAKDPVELITAFL